MLKLKRDSNPLLIEDYDAFGNFVNEVLGVRRHIELMHLLQGSLQHYIPHDIVVAAWGDFHLGVIHYDVVSAMRGVHSESLLATSITPLLTGLFSRWVEHDRCPFSMNAGHDGFTWEGVDNNGPIAKALSEMKSSLVHGIGDQRGRHDCLYVFFSQHPKRRNQETKAVKILLPYIDFALRQVDLMPNQYQASKESSVNVTPEPDAYENEALSEREAEIMKWVALGKTNGEIGSILNVSAFTIKNHMQRIFKKLDVFNRAQAVSNFKTANVATATAKAMKKNV
jgi:transcriptional regulator EpsA